MSNVLFVAQIDFANMNDGVAKKVKSQINALEKMGSNVDCCCYNGRNITIFDGNNHLIIGSYKNSKIRRFSYWSSLSKYIRNVKYDMIFIRYSFIDTFVLHSLKIMSKNTAKIVVEIPTFPLEKEKLSNTNQMLYMIDKQFHNKIHKYIDRILYIGESVDSIWGCEAIRIPNGYPYELEKIASYDFSYDGHTINIIGVSSMTLSHGYDRLIEGINRYYKNKTNHIDIRFYLVGDGPCKKDYLKLSQQYKLEDHIIFMGPLHGQELSRAFEKATIAVGCLGLYRNGHSEASLLKVKEYMIRGIPFINAGKEIGMPDNFPYMCILPNDDSPIDINTIIEFVETLNDMDHESIKKNMRHFCFEYYSWESILTKACGDYLL